MNNKTHKHNRSPHKPLRSNMGTANFLGNEKSPNPWKRRDIIRAQKAADHNKDVIEAVKDRNDPKWLGLAEGQLGKAGIQRKVTKTGQVIFLKRDAKISSLWLPLRKSNSFISREAAIKLAGLTGRKAEVI